MKLVRMLPTLALQLDPASCSGSVTFSEVLSGKYDKERHIIAEEKFDGLRYLFQLRPNGAKANYLTSRRISRETGNFVEKQEKVPSLMHADVPTAFHGTVLDGEFCSEGISSDTQHAMASGRGQYRAWDVLFYQGTDVRGETLEERSVLLQKVLNSCKAVGKLVSRVEVWSKPSLLLKDVIARNGEGVILKDKDAPYGEGWIKAKGCITEDCVIIGFEMSTEGKYAVNKWVKNVLLGQYVSVKEMAAAASRGEKWAVRAIGLTLNVKKIKGESHALLPVGKTSGMTEEVRAELTANQKKYLHQAVEVEAHLRLPSGLFRSPRFNRFRFDKNAEACIWHQKS